MTDIFEDIKKRVHLEDIIKEDFPLRGHGHDFRGDRDDCSSLIVTRDRKTGQQYYYWNSKGEGGDAVNWLKNRRGMDTKSAVEYLCRKVGILLPDWTQQDTKSWMQAKVREDVLSIASKIFARWLQASPAATAYVRGRGWSDETIKAARLGFSGAATAAEYKEIRAEMSLNNIDPESPAAVAILGYKGDVAGWAQRHEMMQAIDADDISGGYIAGIMGRPRLVYPHLYFERVTYMSTRNLAYTDDLKLIGEPDKHRKSFNPRKDLIGERQPYFGFNYKADAKKVVIIEGQADAVTLSQWGFTPVAMAGVHLGDEWGKTLAERHESIYFATDADEAGQAAIRGKNGDWPIAEELGPLTMVVRWPEKDANDLLQKFVADEIPDDEQRNQIQELMDAAAPVAVLAVAEATKVKNNADKQRAMERAFAIIAKIPTKTLGLMLKDFVVASGMKYQDFNRALKAAKGEAEENDEASLERIPTIGGWYKMNEEGTEGYLLEMLYDPKKVKCSFAYARIDLLHPEKREVGEALFVDIDGKRYEPMMDDNIKYGTVMLASDLGPERPTNELLAKLEFFMRRYFLLDNALQYKTASQYALFTWLYDAFDALPYLRARGGPGSGKSELMLLIGRVCYRMMITSSLTSLAGFKGMAHLYKGSLMIDEADSIPKEHAEELKALLNGRAMREQARIVSMQEVMLADGSHSYAPKTTYVYGPTLLTMYGAFRDPATETRCITFDLFQKDVQELEEAGIEPGVVQQSMKDEAQILRNELIRWRLNTWLPKLEVPQGVKISNKNTSPRMNQIMRPLKILAYLLRDEQMQRDLDLIAETNYEDELNRRAGSFEAVLLRAVIAADEDKKYADYVRTGTVGALGPVRYVFYKDLAFIANEIIDTENMNEKATEKGRGKDDSVKAQTIGTICRDAFRLPVQRMAKGWAVVLDKKKIEIGKLRFGLRDEKVETQPIQERML